MIITPALGKTLNNTVIDGYQCYEYGHSDSTATRGESTQDKLRWRSDVVKSWLKR